MADPNDPFAHDEDPIEGLREHLNWQPAWLRAIAMAWQCKEYEERLCSDDDAVVRKAFQDVNYVLPKGLKIRVKHPDVAKTEELNMVYSELEDGSGYGWHRDALTTEVIFRLPQRPQESHQAYALADYLASGRSYPFTCC